MIVGFYKKTSKNPISVELIEIKNISCVPNKGTVVWFFGQRFLVEEVHFYLDACEYRVYVRRI